MAINQGEKAMADYKNIPVDQETYEMLAALCEAYERKQGAQVKALVKVEYEKLAVVKLIGKIGEPEAAKKQLAKA